MKKLIEEAERMNNMSVQATFDEGNLVAHVSCPVCESRVSRFLFGVRDYAFQVTDVTFGVRRCTECGCGYLSPRPVRVDLVRYYTKDFYWSYECADRELVWDEIIARRRVQLDGKAKWLDGVKPGRLLDIGTQKGEFLWMMARKGWQVEGTELDLSVPNPANMPIRYGDFLTMEFQSSVYDCITMWAVLEHVYTPAEYVNRIANLLRPGGRFIALVTNFNSVQGRFFRADDYPRHLTFYTKSSIRHLCRRYGLNVIRVKTNQKIFTGALNGGLVYGFKRLLGYTAENAFSEWKQILQPDLFWCYWHGKPSALVRNISRADRAITLPVEKLLDRPGYGFIMTFVAERPLE